MIDGRPLTEVAAILFYLARRYPDAALLPDNHEDQAQVISWMSFLAATVHPARRSGLEYARRIWPGRPAARVAGLDRRRKLLQSPISTCFGYSGGSSTHSIRRQRNSPASCDCTSASFRGPRFNAPLRSRQLLGTNFPSGPGSSAWECRAVDRRICST